MLCVSVLNSSSVFQRYGTHRDLHSFPTRRSSDLPGVGMPQRPCEYPAAGPANARSFPAPGDAGELFRVVAPCAAEDRDRKSTRLNSSHLGISYAVFCLKKKKTNEE